ncbi:MAG: hypothetical protein ACM359_19495 [Bacillota bacterium]
MSKSRVALFALVVLAAALVLAGCIGQNNAAEAGRVVTIMADAIERHDVFGAEAISDVPAATYQYVFETFSPTKFDPDRVAVIMGEGTATVMFDVFIRQLDRNGAVISGMTRKCWTVIRYPDGWKVSFADSKTKPETWPEGPDILL